MFRLQCCRVAFPTRMQNLNMANCTSSLCSVLPLSSILLGNLVVISLQSPCQFLELLQREVEPCDRLGGFLVPDAFLGEGFFCALEL